MPTNHSGATTMRSWP